MKAIMVMFDSLNRRFLSPYGCDYVHTPNFGRLAERTVTFDTSYVGSMPCMPARREIHTGRYNFLHRGWGPLEPFDDSMPRILKENGIYTHICSDHYHYWEDGGATYHTQYSSWEFSRGQEVDPWKGVVSDAGIPETLLGRERSWERPNWINRQFQRREEDMCQTVTFAMGEEFIRTNHGEDNWFLTIETFDPHEPYHVAKCYQEMYDDDYDGPEFDWPHYAPVIETPEQVHHCRTKSMALHTMCDHYLGKIIDLMDELNLWDDTMLIVNTDHGFLMTEHGWWGKCAMPFYNEIANTPLFIWDPRSRVNGERRKSLVQTIDLAPTLLDYFGVEIPKDMKGRPLADTITGDTPVHEAGLYGSFGFHVNVTDGRYVYMRGPSGDNRPLFEHTLLPTHMKGMFGVDELQDIRLAEPFEFTKGCSTMKIGVLHPWPHELKTMLFDLSNDPGQEHPIDDPEIEQRMIGHLVRLMQENDAPAELYERLDLPFPSEL